VLDVLGLFVSIKRLFNDEVMQDTYQINCHATYQADCAHFSKTHEEELTHMGAG
jgi:hypothetical protein